MFWWTWRKPSERLKIPVSSWLFSSIFQWNPSYTGRYFFIPFVAGSHISQVGGFLTVHKGQLAVGSSAAERFPSHPGHNALPSQQVWLPHPAWSWTAACAGGFSNHKHVLKIGGRQTLNAVLICRWSYPPKPRDLQLQAGVQSYWVQTKENFTRWNHRKLPL